MRHRWLFAILFLATCAAGWSVPLQDPALLALLAKAPTTADYPRDDAVWLRRELEITVAPSGAMDVHEHRFLTLLTEQALGHANWQIPYDKAGETLKIVTARTLLGENAFPYDPLTMVENAVYPGAAWYDSLVVRCFPLPGARPGATLEVDSLLHHNTARMAGDFSTRLRLQDVYPIREALFTVRVPLVMRLNIRFTGEQQPAVRERDEKGMRVYSWDVHDVPPLRITEPLAPSAEELLATARISSQASWAPVAAWYAKITAGKATLTDELKRTAAEETKGCTAVDEKVARLHKFVRELPYVGMEMGMQSDVPHSAADVLQRRCGDCKDKATLLRALLAAAGIESDYVLLRTASHGPLDRQLFSPSEFNHVILAARLPGGDRFLDATSPFVPATGLPPDVEGAEGLIVRGAGELVTLPATPAQANRMETAVAITMKEDGKAAGRAVMTFTGLNAVWQREALSRTPKDRYREALEGTLAPRLGGDITVDTVRVDHLREPEQSLVITAEFSSRAYLQPAGTLFSAYLPCFTYQPNRFRAVKERLLPFVQRSVSSVRLETTVTVPDGFTVAGLPKPVEYTGPAGTFHDEISSEGQTIRYCADLASTRGTFPASALEDFRQWGAVLALEGRNQLQFFLKKE